MARRVLLTNRTLIDHEIVWPDGQASKGYDLIDRQVMLPPSREARIVRSARRQFRVYDGGLSSTVEER